MRWLTLAALLALCACARHAPPATALQPSAAAPAPPSVSAPAAAPATSTQSEIEQATASQESAGNDSERDTRSDASLERIAGAGTTALPAGKWQPGVNYDPLAPAQPTSVPPGKVEVMEVFWLACPHCYELEPYMRRWLKSKPAYVEFVRVPVIWQPQHLAHAKLFYTLKALGRPDLIDKAFQTIQQQHNPLIGDSDAESLKIEQTWAAQNGVGAADFANAYNSFSVNSDLARAQELTQRYRIESVPSVIINGKYITEESKVGSPANLFRLIDDLAASEHRH